MSVLAAVPVIPGVSCPPAASALGAAGLGPVCQAAAGASGLVGSAASQVVGFGVGSVLDALGSWVSSGAVWLLAQVGSVLSDTTGIDLGASWFTSHYLEMAALCGVVIVPLMLLGVMQSLYRQNASQLIRSVVVNVPLAILLTAVAVKLVQLGLAVTDAMSQAVAQGSGLDTGHFLAPVALGLGGGAIAGPTSAPSFVIFLGSIAVVFGAVLVWIELLIRSAAVYVAVLFLPLALASLAWPAIAHWCRRLVDTLVALILGKFVIVTVLSLAAGALAAGTGSTPSGASSAGGGITAVLAGAALLFLAAFSPWVLFRLLPFVEAGAVGHLEGLSQRAHHTATAPARSLAQTALRSMASRAVERAAASGESLLHVGGGDGSAGGSGPEPVDPSGGGPGGSPPDPGPSSAASTGVGTMEAPGHGIPMHPGHPEGTALARKLFGEGFQGVPDYGPEPEPEPDPGPGGGPRSGDDQARLDGFVIPPGVHSLKPLPLATAARQRHMLGRDHLGPVLVSGPLHPEPDAPDDH
jgi:hypothetical protein